MSNATKRFVLKLVLVSAFYLVMGALAGYIFAEAMFGIGSVVR